LDLLQIDGGEVYYEDLCLVWECGSFI